MAEESVSRLQELAKRRASAGFVGAVAADAGPDRRAGPRAELERVRAELRTLRLRYRDDYPEVQAPAAGTSGSRESGARRRRPSEAADAAAPRQESGAAARVNSSRSDAGGREGKVRL